MFIFIELYDYAPTYYDTLSDYTGYKKGGNVDVLKPWNHRRLIIIQTNCMLARPTLTGSSDHRYTSELTIRESLIVSQWQPGRIMLPNAAR